MYTLYKFHFLNGISEINQLFDDILIIWPAPVYYILDMTKLTVLYILEEQSVINSKYNAFLKSTVAKKQTLKTDLCRGGQKWLKMGLKNETILMHFMNLSGKLTSLKLESLITLHDFASHHKLNLHQRKSIWARRV